VVVPSHLCSQWERELKRFLPSITTHVIRGFKNYPLPLVDVIITSYNRLNPWQDLLLGKESHFKTIIFDEVHELRHDGTAKYEVASSLAKDVENCLGMSGTPIYNYGSEIFNILNVVNPGCLGEYYDFNAEWCTWGKVNEPSILNNFLKTRAFMLRRTPEAVNMKFGAATKQVITIDADLEKLKEIQNVTKMLALTVLSGNLKEIQSEHSLGVDDYNEEQTKEIFKIEKGDGSRKPIRGI
jgi:SWI/SNF-related matrix-associated actin-dependent regulator of chromatin subfamily A-like protein 1